jgi:hypothetical protein
MLLTLSNIGSFTVLNDSLNSTVHTSVEHIAVSNGIGETVANEGQNPRAKLTKRFKDAMFF